MMSRYVNAYCSRWYGWLVFKVVFILHRGDPQARLHFWQVLFINYTGIMSGEKNIKENTELGLHTSRTIRTKETEIWILSVQQMQTRPCLIWTLTQFAWNKLSLTFIISVLMFDTKKKILKHKATTTVFANKHDHSNITDRNEVFKNGICQNVEGHSRKPCATGL